MIAVGRFANDGASSGSSCRGSSPRRSTPSAGSAWSCAAPSPGFVRAYALLLIGGFAALGLYFLIVSIAEWRRGARDPGDAVAAGRDRASVLRRAAQGGAGAGVARQPGGAGPAIALVADFHAGEPGLQHTVNESWIPDLGVRYQLGVDGISLFLILLTALLWAGATIFSAFRVPDRPRIYFFMLGLGETATLGAFLAQDLLLFVLFFDLMLVPFWFLIGAFGGENRIAATTKMIVYTLVGSLLMLVAAIATAILASDQVGHLSFSLADLRAHTLATGSQDWIFLFFAAAFLIKMPAVLVHGWMPDAYRAAPLPVLALLAGVLSKVGAYGFLRVALPLYPQATVHFQELILVIGVASILYGSVMAFTQTNVRLIAGYSSIAQLGFITIGIFSLRPDGADGSVLQMVNHGLVVAPIFLIVALLWERSGSEDLDPARRPGDARAGARGAVPDRHAGDPGDAGVRQLHRRVLHPDRRLPGEDRLRLRGHRRGRVRGLLRDPPLPAHDAQPARRERRLARDRRSATRRCWRRSSPASSPWRSTPG